MNANTISDPLDIPAIASLDPGGEKTLLQSIIRTKIDDGVDSDDPVERTRSLLTLWHLNTWPIFDMGMSGPGLVSELAAVFQHFGLIDSTDDLVTGKWQDIAPNPDLDAKTLKRLRETQLREKLLTLLALLPEDVLRHIALPEVHDDPESHGESWRDGSPSGVSQFSCDSLSVGLHELPLKENRRSRRGTFARTTPKDGKPRYVIVWK
jgi:hypothetical protein